MARGKRSRAGGADGGAARKARRRRGLLSLLIGFLMALVWRITWRLAFVGVLILALWVGYDYMRLPPAEQQVDARTRGSVTLLDRNGRVFAWRGEQFGGVIRPDNVSPWLRAAVVATEDRRFYRHFGISPRGILSAIAINLREGRGPFQGNGGSTITQQVAKLLCLGRPYDPASGQSKADYEAECRKATLSRKLKEVPFALAMELKYTKDQILMIYLNRAYLGAGAQGFQAAAERYFGKSASDLSIAESAMLAGLLVAPSYYSPTSNLKRAQERANVVIGLMEEQGYITPEQAARARANPAVLSDAARAMTGGYFADWIMETGPDFLTRKTTEDVVIRTTFDPEVQAAAEEALTYVFETRVSRESRAQAAIVVLDRDGAVRAMVGGRQTRVAGQFNRATHARRQTGSSFKPFVYAAALDLGYRFDSIVEDGPLTIDVPGSGPWSPRNYDGKYRGPVTLTEALVNSLNTAAVRVSEAVGRDAVRAVARGFGIRSELDEGPALALGTSELTLLEMTGAYAGFLNLGVRVDPYGLLELRLQGDDAPLIEKSGGVASERVISEQAARQLVYMMNQVVERGSGRRARLPDRQAAGKTGTTQGARDAWFIGFTADYVVGVWMGYDDNTKLRGVTGGGLPAEIWKQIMLRIETDRPPRPLDMIDPAVAGQGPARVVGEVAGPLPEDRRGQPARDPVQTIIDDVLGALFGRRF